MKSIGVTLQRTYLTKKLRKETLCDIQLSSPNIRGYTKLCHIFDYVMLNQE